MAKPVIWTIDDDANVLSAVERDLRRHYGRDYKIMRADSGDSALEALKQLKVREDPVALFLVDQRMPGIDGVEFLIEARKLYPEAKRVLLTAYADTEVAIKAINTVKIDHYLTKPWDPAEENLYPVLDDLLGDWQSGFCARFEGIRIVGHRWSPVSHAIKDFLARNLVPFRWLDIEEKGEACALIESLGLEDQRLPVVVFEDSTYLIEPSNSEVAEKVGLRTHAEMPFYDLVIVGGGPAGLAAAVYGASEGLSTVLIEKEAPGGQAGTSSMIENYLGFPQGISGRDLTRRAVDQARKFNAEILSPQEVVRVRIEDQYRILTLSDGSEVSCYALLLATGVSWRKMNVPGIDKLSGAGVYYGASRTEAKLCADEHVFIIGGANSAGQAAMYFSEYAAKVTMLVRAESLSKSMSQYLIDQIEKTSNIVLQICCEVSAVKGEDKLETVTLRDTTTGEEHDEPATSVFIFIGAEPCTEWLNDVVLRDKFGYILAGPDLMTDGKRPPDWPLERDPYLLESSVPGIFVAGDVRHGSVKRVAAGAGTGSVAVQFVHQYLAEVQGGAT